MGLRAFIGALVFAAGTGLAVCPAAAADLPVAPAPVPVAPVASAPAAIFSWTGLYIGGHGGGGGRSSWSDPVSGANNIFASGDGFVGGAQAGANLQSTGSSSASRVTSATPGSRATAGIRLVIPSMQIPIGHRP